MKKRTWLYLSALILLISLFSGLSLTAKAQAPVPYEGYDYNLRGESVAAPVGYKPENEYYGLNLGLEEPFNGLADIFYDKKDTLFILDSGNSRIIALDTVFNLKKIFSDFIDTDGSSLDFSDAQGFTVGPEGDFYIADTARERIVIVNGGDGSVKKIITRPDEALTGSDAPFDVTKVLLDNKGTIYALTKSVNLGAFVFTPEGGFIRFFGSTTVTRTSQVVMNYFFRRFMTPEQLKRAFQSTPISISNFCADDSGFIYTCIVDVNFTTAQPGWVRKLNYNGENILNMGNPVTMGDVEWDRLGFGETLVTQFIDVNADSEGFINLLDVARGRVFQYTEDGILIAVFGGYGRQKGTFNKPVAMESVGSDIYVLDAGKNCVIRFAPTDYALKYREAVRRLNENDLDDSLQKWYEVSRMNTNNMSAYYGIGRVYDAKGDYKTAMEYFNLSENRSAYSSAWREYRKIAIRDNILWIAAVAAAVIVGVYIGIRLLKKKLATPEGAAYSRVESRYTFPFFTMLHPVDGFHQFKSRNIPSWPVALALVLAWFLTSTLSFFSSGFIFNSNRPVDYNVFVMLFQTAGIFVLFIVSNWAICTLFNGSGKFKEITCVAAYSLLPMLICNLINIILSNVLSNEEAAFMGMLTLIGYLWTFILLFCGLYSIHEYSVIKTLVSMAVTVVGMAVIIFLAVMFFTLIQQTTDFFKSVFSEIELR